MDLQFILVIFDIVSRGDEAVKRILCSILHDCKFQSLRDRSNVLREPYQKIQVQGKYYAENPSFELQSYQIYNLVLRKWSSYLRKIKNLIDEKCEELKTISVQNLPWLTIQSEKAFSRTTIPCHERIPLISVKFGTLLTSSNFLYHSAIQSYEKNSIDSSFLNNLEVSFYHDTRQVELVFDRKHVARFRYLDIRQILVELKENSTTLYLMLVNPPSVMECQESAPININLGHDIGTGTVIPPLYYDSSVLTIPDVPEDVLGRSNMIAIDVPSKYHWTNDLISRLYFRTGKRPLGYTVMDTHYVQIPNGFPDLDLKHFGCTYLLTALFRRRFIMQLENSGNDLNIFVNQLRKFAYQNPECLYNALENVLQLMDEGVLCNYTEKVIELFTQNYTENIHLSNDSNQSKCTKKVWRVVITPTRLLLYPAEEIFGNRVIRQFSCEHALRVSFRDDCFQRLSRASLRCTEEYIDAVIMHPMLDGLRIGTRKFEFLGWSNSQLRDHGCYMYAEDNDGNTAAKIRQWMGDFKDIRNVPKFMARMGQCFSHTEPTVSVPLNSSRIRTEPDVEGGHNPGTRKPYCFSDGVGRISENLMNEVTLKMGFDYIPSAVQFRYAGYKGMLSMDPTLTDQDIVFRESQKKFPCHGSEKLEIVSKSTATALQLNKQLITILDQKGVPAAVFLEIQRNMLRDITEMLYNNEKAAEYLSTHSAMPKVNYKSLAKSGIGLNSEPFFRNVLLAQHRVALEGIKEKARLDIPMDKGRNMLGIMDETGILEYGQVFVQYTTHIGENTDNREKTIYTGKVMVTKNPCLNLGDVRIFEAVYVSDLEHIVDCIVFPSKGPRPHPSEMSGSDLDGDEYAVIWYEKLFFKGENDEACIFPTPRQEIHEGEITVKDMLEFLTKYILNDHLGVIANAHLARADDPDIGLHHRICKSIAHKFSIAVDFAKNGEKVRLTSEEKPEKYPDFMEKGSHANTYKSKRALGKLYRICKEYEDENRISSELGLKIEVDKDFIYPGWQKYKKSAIISSNKYKRILGTLLMHYGVQTDYEACGKALTKIHSRLERSERLDVEEVLTRSIHEIWKSFQDDFFEEFKDIDITSDVSSQDSAQSPSISPDILKKASAWYIVAYSDPKSHYLSFPWICWKILLQIKKQNIKIILKNPYIDHIDVKLQQVLQKTSFSPLSDPLFSMCNKTIKQKHLSENEGAQLKCVLQILLNWGYHHNIFEQENTQENESKTLSSFLYNDSKKVPSWYFAKLFFLSLSSKRNLKVTDRLLDFFGLCLGLRFDTNDDNHKKNLYKKHKHLGKKAMSTYHSLAVGANFSCLGFSSYEQISNMTDITEMEPIRLKSQAVANYSEDNYLSLKQKLKRESGAAEVNIRKIKQYLLVSASGTKVSHCNLKNSIFKLTMNHKNPPSKKK